MENELEKLIDLGKEIYYSITETRYRNILKNEEIYFKWKHNVIRYIYDIYQGDFMVNELNKHIINFDSAYKSKYLYEAIAVLEAFLKRPKIISPYKPYVKAREIHKITPPININIENKNFNTNNQTINLLDKVLRGKLTGEQLDEIKEIIDKNKDEKTAKREVVKKLESFGINTLSNIVSALITNPAIMSSLFG